jgi:hypothetical protein
MPESERHIARQKLAEMEAAMARSVALAGGAA